MQLQDFPTQRISAMAATIHGGAPKKHKDKATALKALGKQPKQKIVLALLLTGGTTIDQIVLLYGIRRAYARDILSKLRLQGHVATRDGDIWSL